MSDVLVAYGLDDRLTALYSYEANLIADALGEGSQGSSPELFPGRVVRVDRTSCLAATPGGVITVDPDTVLSRRLNLPEPPAAGDWVVLAHQGGTEPAVVGILPRRSELSRRAPADRARARQVLAANIDLMAVTVPLDRPLSASRIERTLVLAWESGAMPIIVLTKADIAGDVAGSSAAAAAVSLGVEVVATSGVTGTGTEALRATIGRGTLAFIGPSGSGKSTLVNALVGENVQLTGHVRQLDGRGRHTTTSRDLIALEGGGVLLDTPGLRSLGLLDADVGMAATFADIGELAGGCRFNDCAHEEEPGCAVTGAVTTGELDPRRLENYHKMLRELAFERRRHGEVGYAERRKFRAQMMALHREAGPTRLDERRQRWG